jgi:hypothetical protein
VFGVRDYVPLPISRSWFARIFADPVVRIGLLAWLVFALSLPFLAHGSIPFDQPWATHVPYSLRIWGEILGPFFDLWLIAVVYALTHHRSIDVATRSPERSVATRETIGVLVYGAVVLIAGQFVGHLFGPNGIDQHLPGSMFGLSGVVTPSDVYLWSTYNFVFYALIPYIFFRSLGYSNEALCLRSSDLRNDALVIAFVLAIGLADGLPGNRIWQLNPHQLALGAFLAFTFSLFGTGLPIMIFLCSILVPRYKKLTGSTAATVVLGGFTYASLHLAESWTRYDTPAHALLSIAFIMLLFGGPGMLKSYLTQRTGNAWVHLWGYHAIWPHVTADTPIFVKIFDIH